MEVVGDCEAAGQVADDPEEPAAQLFEVLHEAHAGELGAVLNGVASAVDEVS